MTEFDTLNEALTSHLEIILRCTLESDSYGRLLLASPPKTRYPYIYPRDSSSAAAFLRRVACSPKQYDARRQAFELVRNIAAFLKDVCKTDGLWGQRYGIDGGSKSIYQQEDNVAHGISILCNYLLAARALDEDIPDLDEYLACIDSAASRSLEKLYHPELNLFHSTTAIHESALESGYTCWVNFSFLYAFSLANEVAEKIDRKGLISKRNLEFRKNFLYAAGELFTAGNRYVRRISAEGHVDFRPDITLLSPFYYGFLEEKDELAASVSYLEKNLWDPELGMIMRFLPFRADSSVHVHAGNGPWLQYTAILAQYHYWAGNLDRGDQLLNLIDSFCLEDEIPEHLSTCDRFEEFMEKEWKTGIDFAKEFDEGILLKDLDFDRVLEEANNMARSYHQTAKKCLFRKEDQPGGGFIQFAVPLMWSHVEYARALMIRAGDWWKMDGEAA